MSENNSTCSNENAEAAKIIEETVKYLVWRGIIHCRDDIIRHLCGGNFTIVDVTDENITICVPDEPKNTLTLSGWLFSGQFILGEGARGASSRVTSVPSEKTGLRKRLLSRVLSFAGYAH